MIIEVFLITYRLSYAFLIRLDLRVPIVRNFQFDLSIKHVIKLILYDNDTNLLKIKRSPTKIDLRYIWSVRFWLLIPEMNTWRKSIQWLICFSIVNLMLECLWFKKSIKFNKFENLFNLFLCQKQLECRQYILNKI